MTDSHHPQTRTFTPGGLQLNHPPFPPPAPLKQLRPNLMSYRQSLIHSGRILTSDYRDSTSRHKLRSLQDSAAVQRLRQPLAVYTASCVVSSQSAFVSLSWKRREPFLSLCFFFSPSSQAPICFCVSSQLRRCDLNKLHWALSAMWDLLSVTASSARKKKIHLKKVTYSCILEYIRVVVVSIFTSISLIWTKLR